MTKYYVNENGDYIGGYDGAEPPEGSIEVPTAPLHALDTWNGVSWQEHIPSVEYPEEFVVKDIGTGNPVKVVIKDGEVFVGGDDETPSE